MRLERNFYIKEATELAPLLLGKVICHSYNGEVIKERITETEAYMQHDTACHANRGRTKRNGPMFLAGGHFYVYLCYGIHEMLNIVSGEAGKPEAVLIRGIEGVSGPGRVTKALKIDRSLNGLDLVSDNNFWIEDDGGATPKYTVEKRIGIDYADEIDKNRLWRFVVN